MTWYSQTIVGLTLKNQSSSDNPVVLAIDSKGARSAPLRATRPFIIYVLAIERYWMTSCKSRL